MKAALPVFFLALAAHLTYFALDSDHIARDTRKYVIPADNLLSGHGFARDGVPETNRTPGYPLLLAAFKVIGLDLRRIVLLQHLASAVVAAALLLIARRMTGDALIATVAGIAMAIDLPTIHHANNILSETLFTLMGLLLFAIIWRIAERHGSQTWQAVAGGLLLGAMTLVRPVAMLFFIPMALYLGWVRRDAMRRIVPAFVICAVLLPAAWLYRNHRLTGVSTLSTNSSILMLYFHAAGALAIDDPGDFDMNLVRRQAELRRIADTRVRNELEIADVDNVLHIRRAASEARLGREIVLTHPFAFAKLFLRGIAINLLGGSADALTRITALSRSAANQLLLIYTGVALVLAVIGQVWLLKTDRRLGVLILMTIGYFIVFTAGALSYSRFRVPVVPMYAIAIGAGVHALREAWLRHRLR